SKGAGIGDALYVIGGVHLHTVGDLPAEVQTIAAAFAVELIVADTGAAVILEANQQIGARLVVQLEPMPGVLASITGQTIVVIEGISQPAAIVSQPAQSAVDSSSEQRSKAASKDAGSRGSGGIDRRLACD